MGAPLTEGFPAASAYGRGESTALRKTQGGQAPSPGLVCLLHCLSEHMQVSSDYTLPGVLPYVYTVMVCVGP